MKYRLTHTVSREDAITNEIRIRFFQPMEQSVEQTTYNPYVCDVFCNGLLLLQGIDYFPIKSKIIFSYSIIQEGDILVINFILPNIITSINIM